MESSLSNAADAIYRRDRKAIAAAILQLGMRRAASATGMNAMRIHRYVHGTGADDALTHYRLQYWLDTKPPVFKR